MLALLTLVPTLRNPFAMAKDSFHASAKPALVCPWRQEWPVKPAPGQPSPYASQCGQDAFLDTVLFAGAKGGLYLDIGCNDGKSNSNTWFFNRHRQWTGVCFEADPKKFSEIKFSGRSDGINAAVSKTDGTAEFSVVNVADGGLSGLSDTLDHARAKTFGPMRGVFNVPTVSPLTLLKTHYKNASRALDFVSIDVEGHELEVLRAWPLRGGGSRVSDQRGTKPGTKPWCVNVFTVENNHW